MKTIYLVGFMGSGKSTVGQLLSKRLNLTQMDTDEMIINEYGDIATIFAYEGEGAFRGYETDVLYNVPKSDYVVSTGGGIIEKPINRNYMHSTGSIVHLHATFAQIMMRLGEDTTRPLWGQNGTDRYKLYKRREPIYRSLADITIATDQKSPESIVEEIIHELLI